MLWYSLTPSLDLGNQSPVDLVIHILLILLASLLRDLLPAFWIRSIVLPRPIVRDAPECIVTMLGTVLDERFDLLIGDHDGFRDVRSVGDLVENGGGEEHLVQFSNCAEFRLGDGDARDAKGRPLVVCICHNFLAMHALDLDFNWSVSNHTNRLVDIRHVLAAASFRQASSPSSRSAWRPAGSCYCCGGCESL